MSNPESDDLSAKLRACKVDSQVPNSFQRGVWQRIATRQAIREVSFWPLAREWLAAQIARPPYAAALVVVSLIGSLGIAHLQAREANARHRRTLESRYVNSVDPLAMTR